jgi:hydrogenase small subunit
MGCKGPVTFQNCPNVGWNGGTNWPIGCGHPCIGCAEPDFWDKMTPFYQHLPPVPGFGVGTPVDKVGLWATVGVGAAFAAHGVISLAKRYKQGEPTPTAREQAEAAERRARGQTPETRGPDKVDPGQKGGPA